MRGPWHVDESATYRGPIHIQTNPFQPLATPLPVTLCRSSLQIPLQYTTVSEGNQITVTCESWQEGRYIWSYEGSPPLINQTISYSIVVCQVCENDKSWNHLETTMGKRFYNKPSVNLKTQGSIICSMDLSFLQTCIDVIKWLRM